MRQLVIVSIADFTSLAHDSIGSFGNGTESTNFFVLITREVLLGWPIDTTSLGGNYRFPKSGINEFRNTTDRTTGNIVTGVMVRLPHGKLKMNMFVKG